MTKIRICKFRFPKGISETDASTAEKIKTVFEASEGWQSELSNLSGTAAEDLSATNQRVRGQPRVDYQRNEWNVSFSDDEGFAPGNYVVLQAGYQMLGTQLEDDPSGFVAKFRAGLLLEVFDGTEPRLFVETESSVTTCNNLTNKVSPDSIEVRSNLSPDHIRLVPKPPRKAPEPTLQVEERRIALIEQAGFSAEVGRALIQCCETEGAEKAIERLRSEVGDTLTSEEDTRKLELLEGISAEELQALLSKKEIFGDTPEEELRSLVETYRKYQEQIIKGEVRVISPMALDKDRKNVLEQTMQGTRFIIEKKGERLAVLTPYAGAANESTSGLPQEIRDKIELLKDLPIGELKNMLAKRKVIALIESLTPKQYEKIASIFASLAGYEDPK